MAITHFQRILEIKLKEAVEKRRDFVAFGGAADYPTYRESVGFLLGLQEALKICQDIESESNEWPSPPQAKS